MDIVQMIEAETLQNTSSDHMNDPYYGLENVDYFRLHPGLSWTYLCILCVSIGVGGVGNTLIIAAVLMYNKLRIRANVFVVSLAVADISISIITQSFSVVGLTLGYGFFKERMWLCYSIGSLCIISCASSLHNMTAIAVNRYVCICHNHWYQRVYTNCFMVGSVIAVWVAAILFDFPQHVGWGSHTFDRKSLMCTWDRLADYNFVVFSMFGKILIPILIVLFCYISIYLQVRRSQRRLQKLGARVQTGKTSTLQLAITLFIIFIVFCMTWAPLAIITIVDFKDRFPKPVHLFALQFAHTNSCFNSLIYGLSNPSFREGYWHVLKRGWVFCMEKKHGFQLIKQNMWSHESHDSSVEPVSL